MSSRSGRRSRSRSRESPKRSRKDERPWLKRSRSRNRSSSSSSSSRSRSSRRRSRRSHSRSKSPVRPVMSKDPKYVNARVFVANLASDRISSADLLDIFKRHGKVVDTLVHHNGYGFVQFSNEGDARKAVEAETGTVIHGKALKCNMAAERKKGEKTERGGEEGPGNAGGREGAGYPPPPPDDRFGRGRSPPRDPYRPPLFDDPYLRRDFSPHPRMFRDLPPPPRDFRDLPFPPRMRNPRDLPLPPRDPFYDDPYGRPLPPDPYYDRFPTDPYRRDPFVLDPYRDPYRDPYGPGLFDPVVAPKKPVAVDCEIIVMTSELRCYADAVEKRLKNINLLTNVRVIREDQTIHQQVEEAAHRSCLFAIIINSQNEIHRSLTVNILHGTTQEHRNMPVDDAVTLVARSFEKFLTAEKEKVAAQNKEKLSAEVGGQGEQGSGTPHPRDIGFLLKLLAENNHLTVEELDKVISYLQEKRDKALGVEDRQLPRETTPAGYHQPQPQPQPAYPQQHQPPYQHPEQHQPPPQLDLQSKILSMMNGASAAPTSNSAPQNTLTSHTTPLMPATVSARPPPPPSSQQQSTLLPNPAPQGATSPHDTSQATSSSAPSVSSIITPATLINFDNPTVQKALDNLIQSGSSLLKNISASTGQGTWPGQGTTLATSQQPGGYSAASRSQQPPF